MDATALLTGLVVGLLLGAALAWLTARTSLLARAVAAESERDVLRERLDDLEASRAEAVETLTLLAPLRDSLVRVERQVGALERDRVEQFGELGERLTAVSRSTETLRSETASLASALNASTVRGAWGEIQLRRVLELSGLLPRCDFDLQVSATSRHGAAVRPDAVVNLPGGRHVVVDSKAPMSHYLQAHGEGVSEVERTELLAAHATALRRHVDSLAGKAYWTAFTSTPELVVCFVPAESILSAALADDPGLHDYALSRKVVLASPATLFAVLRTIGAIWQHEALEQHARDLLALGSELHARLLTLGNHVTSMGQSLNRTVEHYNRFVGALETRVLVTARRLHELDLASEPPPSPPRLDIAARDLTVPEVLVPATDPPAAVPGRPQTAADDLLAGLPDGRAARDAAHLARESAPSPGREPRIADSEGA